MSDQDKRNFSEYPDEVNLKEIYFAILESKVFIAWVIAAFTLFGLIYSLWLPKIWTSTALLTVSESSSSSFQSSSSLGGLASIASLGMSNGNSIKGSKAIATAQSREFFDHLLTFDTVLPNLMAAKGFDSKKRETIFYSNMYDGSKKAWSNGSGPPNWVAYKIFRKNMSIDFDPKSNFVTISIHHRSPEFARFFLDLIIEQLNLLSRERALQQSQASLDYLYKELSSFQLNDVRLATSQLIETQLKTQMLARVKVDYALESLDRPFTPMERSSPQRKKIVLLFIMLGILSSLFWVLGKYFAQKNIN